MINNDYTFIKRVAYIIFTMCFLLGFSQDNCENSVFYELTLSKAFENNKNFEVGFDFKFTDATLVVLLESSIFSNEEKLIVEYELANNYFVPCKELKNKVNRLAKRPIDKKLTYIKSNYSNPIFVSEDKVYLFSESLIMQKGVSRVFGGGSAMHTFSKKDGIWTLTNRKILEMY